MVREAFSLEAGGRAPMSGSQRLALYRSARSAVESLSHRQHISGQESDQLELNLEKCAEDMTDARHPLSEEVLKGILALGKTAPRSVVFYVAQGGHKGRLEWLIEQGVNVRVKNEHNGITSLHVLTASDKPHPLTAAVLCGDDVAFVNAKTSKGIPAIRLATQHGHASVVRTLIHHGAEFDEKLMLIAAEHGHVDAMEVLRQAGLDPLKAVGHKTPWEVASAHGQDRVKKYLTQLKEAEAAHTPKGP